MQFLRPETSRISAKTDRGSQTAAVRRYFPIHQLIKILFGKLRRMSALRLPKTTRRRKIFRLRTLSVPSGVYAGAAIFALENKVSRRKKHFLTVPAPGDPQDFSGNRSGCPKAPVSTIQLHNKKRVWFEFICIQYRKIVRKIVFGRLVAEVVEDAKPFISCGFGKGKTASAQIKNFRRDARRGKYAPVRQLERLIRKRGSAPACPRCRNRAPPGRGTWPAPSPIPARAVRAGGPRRRPTSYL